jgi:putative hydroxymethylpyrimidine transport system substrate-binding protein
VLADGPIKALGDLRGKKIGFSVAGADEAVLSTMLKSSGLGLQDVTLVNVNWSLSPALMSGQVDAVIGAFRNFELTQMHLQGVEGRCFYPEEAGLPPYDELIYVANPKSMNAPTLRRFLAATQRAAQYIVNHPSESWQVFAATAPELNDALNKQAWLDTLPRLSQSPAALDAGRYRDFEAYLASSGLIEGQRSVGQLAVDLGAMP